MDFTITSVAELSDQTKFFWEHVATPLITLIVGALGFIGIWATLLFNAWRTRKADKLEQFRTAGALFADIQGNLDFADKHAAMAAYPATVARSFSGLFPQLHPKKNVMEWLSPKLHILSPKCSTAIITAYTDFDYFPELVALHIPQTRDQQQIDRAQEALKLIKTGGVIIVTANDMTYLAERFDDLATSQDHALDMLIEQFPKLKEIREPRMTTEERLKYAEENVTLTNMPRKTSL